MAEEEKKPDAAPAPEKAAGPSKLPLILGAVNLVATLGIVGLLFVSFKKENSGPKVDDMVVHEENAHGEAPKEGAEGAPPAEGGHGAAPADPHAAPANAQNFGKMVPLEQFTVNLSIAGGAPSKFARVNIALEIKSPDTEDEVTQKMPKVRNVIIDLFNSKRPSDLTSPEGRNFLKDEILNAINSFLITGKISGVFFTNFALSS